MRPKTLKRWKKGDPITAQRLNEMLDSILRLDVSVPQGSPLRIQQSSTGTVLGIDLTGFGFLAVANGAIPAGSGITGGTGTAGVGSVYQIITTPSYTSGQLSGVSFTTGTIPITVYNPSSTKMGTGDGIKTSQLCWVQMDQSGLYMVTPLECA
jgi:hypothetical protein